VRAVAVVVLLPVSDEDLSLVEGGKALGVQELISELAVKRFDVAVFPRATEFGN